VFACRGRGRRHLFLDTTAYDYQYANKCAGRCATLVGVLGVFRAIIGETAGRLIVSIIGLVRVIVRATAGCFIVGGVDSSTASDFFRRIVRAAGCFIVGVQRGV
jgi:hypothetical protein